MKKAYETMHGVRYRPVAGDNERIVRGFHVALGGVPEKMQHTHGDCDEIFWCLNDGGVQHSGPRAMRMEADHLFYFPAGCPHVCKPLPGRTADGIVLYVGTQLFRGEGMGNAGAREALSYLRSRAADRQYRFLVSESSRAAITECFWAIHAEDTRPQRGHDTMMRALFQQLCALMLRDPMLAGSIQSEAVIPSNRERLNTVLHYIDRRYMAPITVQGMAKIAGMSRSHFHALFKQETGSTLMEKVLEARARGAARMLQETALPIIDIAYSCGFNSLSHFYRVLKQHTGKSARELRKAALKPAG